MSLVWERPCRRYPFHIIQSATENFNESNVIGKGGFGMVYKGMLSDGWNTTAVAVKRLKPGSKQGVEEFKTEINMLSMCRHSHLVTLMGYCNEYEEMILVYEYMSGGNLAAQLFRFPNSDLTWEQRLKIGIRAARALDYLHTGHSDMVIHLDVKCSNILLDKNMNAKISDLGLSSVVPANQSEKITTFVQGTRGYIDPHYRKSKKCSSQTDVYAFGVVLLELLTGTPVTSGRIIPDPDVTDLANWSQRLITDDQTLNKIIDRSIVNQIAPNCRKSFAKLVTKTLQNDPRKRPSMSKVVAQLEEALALQTGTCPSSSKIYDDLDEYFNIFSLSETSETRDFFDESRPTSRLSSPTTESDENFNIFSTDTSFESSEKRDVLDQSRPTSRLRGPTTDSWMKSVQSRTDALTIPSLSLIPRAENVLPKTVIGFIQKKGKWRRGRD